MQTKIEAYKVVLRRDDIITALVDAAIRQEGSNQLRATSERKLKSWWLEDRNEMPHEVTVYLVDEDEPTHTHPTEGTTRQAGGKVSA